MFGTCKEFIGNLLDRCLELVREVLGTCQGGVVNLLDRCEELVREIINL